MFASEPKSVWWLPTLGFFLFVAIELWMFANPNHIFEDPGVSRHLRTAEFILETGKIPQVDPLSFTENGQPWFDFEWAFETTLGELYRAGGLGLIAAFCFALLGSTVLGIYRMLLQSGFSLTVVVLYTTLAFLTLQLHFSARPVLFTYLFMAVVVEVWYRRRQPLLRDWIILPIIFIAWANLHAGWLAALLFLVISLLGRLLDRLVKSVDGDEAPLIPWVGLTLLCTLATAVNPWGWALHKHVFLLATTYKSFALWDEYLPPNFGAPTMSAITVLFILVVVFLARVFRRAPIWRWEAVGPVLFFLYEGLKAQRHVLLLAEAAAVPIARDMEVLLVHSAPRYLHSWIPRYSRVAEILQDRLSQFQIRQRAAGGDAWLALVTALLFTGLFVRTPIAHHIRVGSSVTPELVTFLHQHPDRFQRPLNTTWNGGPLLWNMRPDFRVSFDDRGDFYGDDTVFSFVGMTAGSTGWREKFDKGNYDSALLDPYLQLNGFLHFLPEWKEVFRDEHVVVYWKDPPSAAPR